MKNKVFICHSSIDHKFVETLSEKLKRDSLDVWFDNWEIKAGDSITQKINKGLEESSFFIIVLSEDSINSAWVKRELNATLMRRINRSDIKILPILLDVTPERLPPLISDLYAVKFSRGKISGAEYNKLITPILEERKSRTLKEHQDVFLETVEHIDIIFNKDKPTKHEIDFILRAIHEEPYRNYFFRNTKALIWFNILKLEGYFSPDKAPSPEPRQEEGAFIIPQWNVLPYLEKISQQVKVVGNEKYADELLEIINNVVKYHVEHNRNLDNDRTWWYFGKILLNIPNDKIVQYLKAHNIEIAQEWIKEWITSKFNVVLPAADIATRLLPKFLTVQEADKEIAEDIIKVITTIKWEPLKEGRRRLYKKEAEPKTLVDAYWLGESFRKNASKIGELCSEKVIYDLADKLKEIFKREHQSHQIDIEWENETYRIKVVRVQDKGSDLRDFDFHCSVGKLKVENEDVKKDILRFLSLEPEDRFAVELRNCRNRESFIKYIRQGLSEKGRPVDLTKCKEIDEKLANLYKGLYGDYSSIWFKSLASSPDVGAERPNSLLSAILRDIVLSKCKLDKKIGKIILSRFIGEEYQYPLFRRLALFIINKKWNKYSDLFWQFIKYGNDVEPFDLADYDVEMYKLLQNNVKKFTLEEKKKIRDVIENKLPAYLAGKEKAKYISYDQQRLYLAMKEDPYFRPLYKTKRADTQMDIKPPSEQQIMTRWGPGPSSLSKEDVLKISNLELAKHLNEFKVKDRWEGPTKEGLAEVLRLAVKEDPNKFVNELSVFSNVDYLYVYNILYGLENAWKEKKSFDWGKLFTFIKQYISKEYFLEDAKRAQGEDFPKDPHIWVINVVADLIHEGTKDDSWAFAEDYFHQTEEIIIIILELLKKLPKNEEQETTHRDAVTEAINTSYGRIIIASILLSLRMVRVKIKKGEKKEWNYLKYDDLLNNGIVEAFTLFGRHMPNFAYLNKSWVQDKIRKFESLPKNPKGYIKWRSFMEGYFFGGNVYQDLYALMRNHYLRAIDTEFKESHAGERLVQHIAIGYLRGNESLAGKESLFKKIIDKWQYSQFREIVSFFWSTARHLVEKSNEKREGKEDEKIKDRIVEFWRWTYSNRDMIKDKLGENYKEFLAGLARLTILLDNIDPDNSQWLMLLAPYVDIRFNSSFFIEYLNKFEDKGSIGFIGKIFLTMLSTTTPNYDQKHIISIIEKIYRFGDKAEANEICNIYSSKGYGFLRPLYKKYN